MATIGVDVGGTFTDFVFFDAQRNELVTAKVPSTPDNPADAILTGVPLCMPAGVAPADIESFLHGSTITTNALIQLRGAECGLLVTRDLKGVFQVQSHMKVGPRHSMTRHRMPALIDERNVFEVTERVDRNGDELLGLDEQELHDIGREINDRGLEAVAISFLFSFANPAHELRAKEIIQAEAPNCKVFCSAEVLPRIREWPRMSTTILNVYLEPILSKYIASLIEGLESAGVTTKKTYLMESNGGVMPFTAVTTGGKAVNTLLSGPAAAVQAARKLAEAANMSNLVTMDLGGTSCDIAFVQGGTALEVSSGEVCGYDLHVPMLDIATIGAGGGTIGRVDLGGRLAVGPRSAGAFPGPAAYGRGGTNATITDADVVLGYLNPSYFLGGNLTLDLDKAIEAVERNIAQPLNLDVDEAALAMVRINDAHMADAIRVVAAKRGVSLSDFQLVGCGGAGPVHAAAVAEELGIRTVLVPEIPGVFAALGLLCTDVAQDYVQTDIVRLDRVDTDMIVMNFKHLEMRALEDFVQQGFHPDEVQFVREVDARYMGQGFEIRVPIENPSSPDVREATTAAFHELHRNIYGHSAEHEAVEIVSYRVRAVVAMPQYQPESTGSAASADGEVPRTRRRLRFADGEYDAQVVRRSTLAAGEVIEGPAVIEQFDTTTVIPPHWTGTIGAVGSLILTR